MTAPTAAEIGHFLEAFRALDSFHAGQKMVRGYGANVQDNDPVAIKVLAWLETLAKAP